MTKLLRLDTTDLKFSDNDTPMTFRILVDGVEINDTTLIPTIKVKSQTLGYVKSINGSWVNDRITITSGDFSDVPIGNYQLEVWLDESGKTQIFPDYGFVRLSINSNSTGIQGNLISSITLKDFQDQFNELAKKL